MEHIKLVFLVSLALVAAHGVSSADDLIRTIFRGTPDSRICESSLRSEPRSAKAGITEGLVLIFLDVAESKFSDSLAYVRRLMKESAALGMKKALTGCAEYFNAVLKGDIVMARSSVSLRNYKFGIDGMRDAANEADFCRQDVEAAGNGAAYKPALIERSRFLNRLSNVAVSLIIGLGG